MEKKNDYNIDDIPIVNEYKWLGITLDKRLSG